MEELRLKEDRSGEEQIINVNPWDLTYFMFAPKYKIIRSRLTNYPKMEHGAAALKNAVTIQPWNNAEVTLPEDDCAVIAVDTNSDSWIATYDSETGLWLDANGSHPTPLKVHHWMVLPAAPFCPLEDDDSQATD